MDWLLALMLGYALGSVPFGLLLARAAGKGDIRQVGSGNIGATNVLRTGSKWLAAAVLVLDAGKGVAAVLLAGALWAQQAVILDMAMAGLGALIGHCFPVWLRFRGGKGVATMLGVSFGLDWRIGMASALTWLVVAFATRVSSLGGIASAVAAACPDDARSCLRCPARSAAARRRCAAVINYAPSGLPRRDPRRAANGARRSARDTLP